MTEQNAPVNPDPFAAPAAPAAAVPPPYVPGAAPAGQAPPPYAQQPPQYGQQPPQYGQPQAYAQQPSIQLPPQAQPPQPQSYTTPDGRPTAMALELPGAATTAIGLYDMHKATPYVGINGQKVKRSYWTGKIAIPMADGTTGELQVLTPTPGYPKVKFQGQVIYRSPKPPIMVVLGTWVPLIAAALAAGLWFGGIVGGLAAFGARFATTAALGSTANRGLVFAGLMVGSVVLMGIAALGLIVRLSLVS